LQSAGFGGVAENIGAMLKQRTVGDYLQPAAIFQSDAHGALHVRSAITDPNDYRGPGTGYRVSGARWDEMQSIPQARSPRDFIADRLGTPLAKLHDVGDARVGRVNEIILAVGPAFGRSLTKTINGLDHERVLESIFTGVAKEGMTARLVRVYHTSDCAAIGYVGAELSGSGIAIGLQSRGTTVIHKKGLPRLHNLELFSFSPSLTYEIYEQIGRNAANYAKGRVVTPIKPSIDNWARLKLIVKTALLHRHETDAIQNKKPQEVFFDWEPDA
jgi:propanediol dehydratase large subunit